MQYSNILIFGIWRTIKFNSKLPKEMKDILNVARRHVINNAMLANLRNAQTNANEHDQEFSNIFNNIILQIVQTQTNNEYLFHGKLEEHNKSENNKDKAIQNNNKKTPLILLNLMLAFHLRNTDIITEYNHAQILAAFLPNHNQDTELLQRQENIMKYITNNRNMAYYNRFCNVFSLVPTGTNEQFLSLLNNRTSDITIQNVCEIRRVPPTPSESTSTQSYLPPETYTPQQENHFEPYWHRMFHSQTPYGTPQASSSRTSPQEQDNYYDVFKSYKTIPFHLDNITEQTNESEESITDKSEESANVESLTFSMHNDESLPDETDNQTSSTPTKPSKKIKTDEEPEEEIVITDPITNNNTNDELPDYTIDENHLRRIQQISNPNPHPILQDKQEL